MKILVQDIWHHLFQQIGFIPHGHCYLWKPELVWLHITSDALIAIAYYSIPITLLYFTYKRHDLPFDWMFQLFSGFIIACGSTHVMEIWTIWHPTYWASAGIKVVTAGISCYTAIALVSLVPKALSLPSPAQLELANRELEREIAERKQIEESLRQSETRYRAVVEDQTELICRFLPDGTFTFVNEAYCRYFGKTQASLIGHTYQPIVFPEDMDYVEQKLKSLSPTNPVTTIINRVIRPDGEIRVNQWINRMIVDQDDRCIEFQAVGRDITELKQAEAALQESQRFVQKIADTAPVILYVYDLIEKCNVYINREITTLLGYLPRDLQTMGHSLLQSIIHPDDLAFLPAYNRQWKTAKENDVFQIEYRMKHRDGEWRYFQCQETVFARTSEGLPKQILGAAVDITDRKLTQQLQAALKEKEILFKEIHHRVKNNLQIIYSLIRLQRRKLKDQNADEVLLDSQNRIKSIALLHEKLYRSQNLSEIDLNQYIPNLVTSLFSAFQISSDRITLKTQIENIPLDVDTAILCGLIINELVSNSLKYAFPDERSGIISIDIYLAPQNTVHLTFSDNGIGMAQDGDRVATTSLGLKLVNDLVSQLEGHILLSCEQGTEFKITFPWRKP